MAESIKFTPSGVAQYTCWTPESGDRHFYMERNQHNPTDEATEEDIPSQWMTIDRGWTKYKPRDYEIQIDLVGTSPGNLETLMLAWDKAHRSHLGVGVLERITKGGLTRELDCRPLAPRWQDETEVRNGVTRRVTQVYRATNPFWRANALTHVDSAFDGVTPVTPAVNNGGDIPSALTITITGIVANPSITFADGTLIKIENTTTHANDVLIIKTGEDEVSVMYTPNGGSETPWLGYRSTDTVFNRLPEGNNTLSIVETGAGTAQCDFDYYLWYSSI